MPIFAKFSDHLSGGAGFVDIIPRSNKNETDGGSTTGEDEVPDDVQDSASGLFTCPKDGCVKEYARHSSLENHILFGECQRLQEKEGLFDKAKVLYQEKLIAGYNDIPSVSTSSKNYVSESDDNLSKGWALKKSKASARFNDRQKNYLNDKFLIGQATGHKVNPEDVSREMRYAKDNSGNRLFTIDEFLTSRQIQSYFSRTASKLKGQSVGTTPNDENTADNFEAATEEDLYQSTRNDIIAQCGLQHPVVYQTYNLCTLNHQMVSRD